MLKKGVESALFRNIVTALIVLNAVVLGALTYRSVLNPEIGQALQYLDYAITWIFVAEISLKLIAHRQDFFKSGWNWFDFIVVGVSILPGSETFSVLRALRVLRILRLLHVVPMLRRITEALLKALPGMGSIMAVLALLIYVASVMATNMFGQTENEDVAMLFGDLPSSALSLFQVMTMDGWRNEVAQVVMDNGHPYAWIFFLIFIFVASFAVLNLFIALVVESLQAEAEAAQTEQIGLLEDEADEAQTEREVMLALMQEMRDELADLRVAVTGSKRP